MSRRLAPTPLSPATLARAARRRRFVPAPPPPEGNGRAIRTGAQAHGENLPTYPAVVAEVADVVSECPWIQASDMPMVGVFAAELTVYRHAAHALASLTPTALTKKHKAQRVNVQRARALNEMARDLGLSTAGRFRLGLMHAKTEAISVKPVRSQERALEVAQILATARALPNLDAEPETVDNVPSSRPTEESTGELVQLHPVEDGAA